MGLRSLANATGHSVEYTNGKTKLNIIVPDELFDDLKSSAIANNRSLSMEARTMIECALRAQKAKEYEH